MDCSPRQRRFNFRAAARTGLICASMSPPCSTASARASIASPSSCFGFTSWTKRNSSAAPVERFLSEGKEEIPGTSCLPAIFLYSSDWISLRAAHPPPHCLQLAQVRTRVRRKCEGASSLSVPAGDSGRDKPSVDVFSVFSLLLLACSEQLARERSGPNNNVPLKSLRAQPCRCFELLLPGQWIGKRGGQRLATAQLPWIAISPGILVRP